MTSLEFDMNCIAVPATALEIDLILYKIAQFLPFQDILTLRRTCKIWNLCFIHKMQSCHPTFTFGTTYRPIASRGGILMPTNEGRELNHFLHLMKRSWPIPFTKYKFQDVVMNTQSVSSFFQLYGNTVHRLKIVSPQNPIGILQISRIIFDQTPALGILNIENWEVRGPENELEEQKYTEICARKLPNLKIIQVQAFEPNRMSTTDCVFAKQLLSNILTAATNLEQIKFHTVGTIIGRERQEYVSLENQVLMIMVEGRMRLGSLKKLKLLEDGEDIKYVQSLLKLSNRSNNSLKLTAFNTRSFSRNTLINNSSQVQQFLASQSQNGILSHLKLVYPYDHDQHKDRWDADVEIQFRVPVMRSVKFLTMKLCNKMAFLINFPVTFPSLAKLYFSDHHCSSKFTRQLGYKFTTERKSEIKEQYERYLGSFPHHGIQELQLDLVTHPESIIQFSKSFPSIRKLELTLISSDLLPAIWVNPCPHLRHLIIRFYEGAVFDMTMDEAMTGIARSKHKQLREKLESREFSKKLIELKTGPAISDLHGLTEFELDLVDQDFEDGEQMTDITGYYGLLQLKDTTLRSLIFHYNLRDKDGEALKMSENCMSFLRKEYGHAISLKEEFHKSKNDNF